MIVQTDSISQNSAGVNTGTGTGSGTGAHGNRVRTTRSDAECRARACEFLTELIGSPPHDLLWDAAHHLQGHSHLHGHELVVIAARDDDHQTVVLTVEDWDAVRRANSGQRRDLLDACSIHDHDQLVTALSAPQPRSWSLNIAA